MQNLFIYPWQSKELSLELRLYNRSYSIRYFEQKLLEKFDAGLISGTTHACIGQEYIGAALSELLIIGDHVFSNHRCHGHYIGSTADYYGLYHEIIGNTHGASSGVGGSQHLYAENFKSNGILGGTFASAAGYALNFKNNPKHSSNISIVIGGDGVFGEGIVYETMNLASLLELPLLIVVENNKWAQSTPIERNMAGSLGDRIKAFGIKLFYSGNKNIVSGANELFEAAKYVRTNRKPAAVLLDTYRLCHHSKNDDNRPQEEVAKAWEDDPLLKLRSILDKRLVKDNESKIKSFIDSIMG